MTLRILCMWFCICCFCSVCAQQGEYAIASLSDTQHDSIPHKQRYTLEEVSVEANAILDPLDTKSDWSKEYIKNTSAVDVSELLQRSSGVNVKSFGPGGLATVSLRGAGAGRSSTVWNGMPLIGSTLGLLDYSLLNANLFESVRLSLGGNALDGSGAIGGGVYLNNSSTLNKGEYAVGFKTVVGSFNRFFQGFNYSVKNGKWWVTTRATWETSENDFTYRIREDLPEITNANAARNQLALLQSVGYNINDKNDVAVHLWVQNNHREIPPTTVQTRSAATVEDKTIRLQGVWNHESNDKLHWTTIAATSYNQNLFDDPINGLLGDNAFRQIYLKSEARYNTNVGTWLVGFSNRVTQAETQNFANLVRQNQLAFFVNYYRSIQDWNLSIALREDLINESLSPISGQIILNRVFDNHFTFSAKVNRHFRAAGLNDLHWAPGGNPDLVPESGWGQEISLHYEHSAKWKAGVNVYNTTIQNWIQWALLEDRNFFSALNLPQVWSRGIEGFVNAVMGRADNQFRFQLSYNYNPSTYQFSLSNPSITESEQVFYAPLHQTVVDLTWERPQYSITYTHRYQSGVTTIIDPLEGFHVGTLRAQYTYKKANIFVEVNNLWDADYRVVERRATAGRYFNVGINFEIINKLKNIE